MITLLDAVKSLVPGAEVSVSLVDSSITWHWPETAPVTFRQVQQEQQRLQQIYNWGEYQRNRAREYPSIEEQLDALYHAGVFPTDMADRIQAVKEKYPRPSTDPQQWVNTMTPVSVEQKPRAETTSEATADSSTAQITTPTMSLEEWFEEQSKMTKEQWLEQQKTTPAPPSMTREQWLAKQAQLK